MPRMLLGPRGPRGPPGPPGPPPPPPGRAWKCLPRPAYLSASSGCEFGEQRRSQFTIKEQGLRAEIGRVLVDFKRVCEKCTPARAERCKGPEHATLTENMVWKLRGGGEPESNDSSVEEITSLASSAGNVGQKMRASSDITSSSVRRGCEMTHKMLMALTIFQKKSTRAVNDHGALL